MSDNSFAVTTQADTRFAPELTVLPGYAFPGEQNTAACPAKRVIRDYFDERNIRYREHRKNGLDVFSLNLQIGDQENLEVNIYLLDENPETCRIEAVYPFRAQPEFAYPLYAVLARENYFRRFGGLFCDERDGELSYRCSLPIMHGLHPEDFKTIFLAVVASATECRSFIEQAAAGKLTDPQREAIIRRSQNLITVLSQCGSASVCAD